eukprot:m.99527 g.99527  ORF g.99527 m.99527 type:complete len:577 (+) comp8721_c0_seq1:38-1768(+)
MQDDSAAPPLPAEAAQRDARFAHLLQPIRDLAQNWNIDVASELEEYLHEIEQLQFTFDGRDKFSFAEAAMLIQGSACIYSKKVEFLYNLVYETLDLIASKKRAHKAAADASDSVLQDSPEQFLPLDDLPEDNNVDLRNDLPVRELIPRAPAGMLPVGKEFDTALTTAKGAVLGNRNDFRMNTSAIHESGALLLGAEDRRLLDTSLRVPAIAEETAPRASLGGHSVAFADNDDYDGGGGGDFDDTGFQFNENDAPITSSTPFARVRDDAPAPAAAGPASSSANMWGRLDPHSPSEEKPFRRLKSTRQPKSVKSKPARPAQSIAQFCAQAYQPSKQRRLPSHPMVAPAYHELGSLFWQEQKRRGEAVRAVSAAAPVPAAEVPTGSDAFELNGDYGNDYGGYDEGGFGDHSDAEYEHVPVPEAPAPMAMDVEAVYDAQPAGSYEDLVRQHVAHYMEESRKFVSDTELARRVQAWEARMRPVLDDEERHPPFDIHEYGSEVLHRLPVSKKKVVQFVDVATESNAQAYEICRLFLATLQLANAGNVEIIPPAGEGSLSLRKLSDKMHHEAMDDFRAPSLLV